MVRNILIVLFFRNSFLPILLSLHRHNDTIDTGKALKNTSYVRVGAFSSHGKMVSVFKLYRDYKL